MTNPPSDIEATPYATLWNAIDRYVAAQEARHASPIVNGGLEGAWCNAWQGVNDGIRAIARAARIAALEEAPCGTNSRYRCGDSANPCDRCRLLAEAEAT